VLGNLILVRPETEEKWDTDEHRLAQTGSLNKPRAAGLPMLRALGVVILSELLDRWNFLWVLCGASDPEPVEACPEPVEGGAPRQARDRRARDRLWRFCERRFEL